MDRVTRLGIQKRIMLYVTVGLAVMFGSFAVVGLRAIQEAIDLVYNERLVMANTTAGILARDFLHIARDAREAYRDSPEHDPARLGVTTQSLLRHLEGTDPFPFFQVTGIWLLTPDGEVVAQAGQPPWRRRQDAAPIVAQAGRLPTNELLVLPSAGDVTGRVPLATIITRATPPPAVQADLVVAVHTASLNSAAPYVPPSFWYTTAIDPGSAGQVKSPQTTYHLEIVNPKGIAVLGIGEDETPGAPSRHVSAIAPLIAAGRAGILLHEPTAGQAIQPHVMAAVPLPASGFYVILEQPVDVALALPLRVRQTTVLLTTFGFLAALLVAWVTTRHVVKPTVALTVAARRMASGDLETPIRIAANDEVGALAASLDTMRQQLQLAHERIEDSNRELEAQVKERTARLAEMLTKVISAQEEERSRLARELHDETAQTLGALSIALDRARESLQDTPVPALDRIVEAKAIASQLLEETRRLILDLRPMILDDLGFGPAIRWYAESRLEERGVVATVDVDQRAPRLSKHREVSLFRIAQEAVNNIARHAQAQHAHIRLEVRDSIMRLVVADDGVGFDPEQALGPGAPVQSVGLLGMQERARLLNGQLQIRSQPGRGTTVAVEIPIGEELD